jgi:outer membrane protein, adhesin transport system
MLKMKIVNLLLLNTCLLLSGFIPVKSQQFISLEEGISIALEQNFSLRIARNQQRIANNNFSPGNAGLLPSVDLRASYAGNLNNTEQVLRDGGQNSLRNVFNTTTNTGLQAGWTLFDGFRGRIRYRQLEELKSVSEVSTRIILENLIARFASEYYFYVQQQQLFNNLQYAVDLSRERVRIEEEHFLLGSGSKVRLLQAQVNLNADSSRLERQYEVLSAARIRMGEVMALPDLTEGYVPIDTVIMINTDLVYDDLYGEVLEQNAAMILARQNLTLSEYDLELVNALKYPFVNINTGYGYTYNTFQSGSLSNQQTWGLNHGITFGINLYDGKNQQRRRNNALIEVENRELTLEQVQQEITADLITIFNAYTNNIRLLSLETQNLEVARENLDIAFDRYRLGALSGFELREVQKDLLEAEERLLSIQYQAKMAEISLMQISGRILNDI